MIYLRVLIWTLIMQKIQVCGSAKWVAQLSDISIKDYHPNDQGMLCETNKKSKY